MTIRLKTVIGLGRAFLFLTLLLTTAGCSLCRLSARRPQVMASYETCILDYNTPFEEDGFSEATSETEPLAPEFFDIYQPLAKEYRLSSGDVVEISVFGDIETVVDHIVIAPDGFLYYTILDGIPAAGRTISELREELTSKLSELFVDPLVTISPRVITNQAYKIVGRIRAPGEYSISGPIRLREAIAESGGLLTSDSSYDGQQGSFDEKQTRPSYTKEGSGPRAAFASLKKSFLIRDGNKLNIDFDRLMYSADESQNIYLRPGDYIHVAPAEVQDIFALGAVARPQRISYTKGLTIMGALTSTSGWIQGTYGADIRKVLVIRGSLECPCVSQIDVKKILAGKARDFYLRPGDVLYFQNKKMRFGRELVRLAIDAFLYSFVSSASSHFAHDHVFDFYGDDKD